MSTETPTPLPAAPIAAAPAAERLPTKSQVKASAIAAGRAQKIKWKGLIAEASTVWAKVPTEELAKVEGDFHRLAGMVQMRYQLSREESNRQVKVFFDKHYAVA